jgi:F0F1-type ATP synthase assembly protein I
MHKANGEPEERPKLFRNADVLRLTIFGWYFATTLVGGIVGGIALDRWLGSEPGFLIGGLVLGPLVGFYGMFKMLMPLYRRQQDQNRQGGSPR